MATRIKNMKLDEISLVDRPANPEARVQLFKRDIDKQEQPFKTEDGKRFPKSDFAFTPTDNVSEWKLRLTSTPGGEPDPRIVGAAVAALGPGFRGQKVQIPSSALSGVKSKVRAAWLKANPDKSRDDLPDVIKSEHLDDGRDDMKKGDVGKAEHMSDVGMRTVRNIISQLQRLIVGQNGNQENKRSDDMVKMEQILSKLNDEEQELINEVLAKSKDPEPESDDIWKSVSPEIKKQFDNMKKEAEEAKAIAKAEQDKREMNELVAKCSVYDNIGKAEDLAEMLKAAQAVSKEYAEKLESHFKVTHEQIGKGKLFGEFGRSGGAPDGGAWSKIDGLAKAIAEKDHNISKAQAVDLVLKQQPELYQEYLNEKGVQ